MQRVFWIAFLLKLSAGLALGWLYTSYYTYQADSILYFEEGSRLRQLALKDPLSYGKILFFNQYTAEIAELKFGLWQQPRAFFMAKLVSVLNLLSGNSYWLSSLYVSLLSFYGCWRLANTLAIIFPSSLIASAIAFLFFPSVVFWSSGLIKETLAMACIAYSFHQLLAYTFGLYRKNYLWIMIRHSLIILFCCYITWKLKYYYLAVLLPVCTAYLFSGYLLNRYNYNLKPVWQVTVFLFLFACILSAATGLHPSLNFSYVTGTIIENHDVTFAASDPEDVIHFNSLQPTLLSLLQNLPVALFSGLFRPLLWEGATFFQWLTGLENLIVLMLAGYALVYMRKCTISKQPYLFLLMVATFVYILLLAPLMAFSAPNFGTLARYKTGYLPFFLYCIFWVISLSVQSRIQALQRNKL